MNPRSLAALTPWHLAAAVALSLGLAQSSALAQQPKDAKAAPRTVAGLRIAIANDVDPRVRADIEEAVNTSMRESTSWTMMSTATARARISPIVRDCFTEDCLLKAGKTLGAHAGLRVDFKGADEIYDWTLSLFDLRSGKILRNEQGNCEMCGRTEVGRTFSQSIVSMLQSTELPAHTPLASAQTVPTPPAQPAGTEPPANAPIAALAESSAPRTVRVRLSVVPADAQILLGEQPLGAGDTSVALPVGSHELRFTHEGFRGVRETLVITESSPEALLVRVHLSQVIAHREVVPGSRGPVDRLGSQRQIYGWVSTGAGAALLASGLYLGSLHGEQACTEGALSLCPEIYDTKGAALTTTALGAVLVTGGVGLLTWELLAGEDHPTASTVQLAPALRPSGAGVNVFGRF